MGVCGTDSHSLLKNLHSPGGQYWLPFVGDRIAIEDMLVVHGRPPGGDHYVLEDLPWAGKINRHGAIRQNEGDRYPAVGRRNQF